MLHNVDLESQYLESTPQNEPNNDPGTPPTRSSPRLQLLAVSSQEVQKTKGSSRLNRFKADGEPPVKKYLTCKKAKRSLEDVCLNCRNKDLWKKRCMYSEAPLPSSKTKNFPSPPAKITTRTQHAPIKAIKSKEEKRDFWQSFVSKCMEEESMKRVAVPDWWKVFKRQDREHNYGSRVALMQQLGCKLFRTDEFFEVLSFLFLYFGYDGKKRLAEVVKIHEGKPAPVRISARQIVKLKCISGGSWKQHFKYKGALNKISENKIQFASQPDVVKFKRSLRCPRIHKFTNPTTGNSLGRYCNFKDILEFTYSTPSIVKHMNFFFEKTSLSEDEEMDDGQLEQKEPEMLEQLNIINSNEGREQREPQALYAIYADGSKQTKVVEITCFGARNMNLGRITRDPAAMQIILLDTAKEGTQFFDSVFIEALNEGIADATKNGVWVICTELFQPLNFELEDGELAEDVETNFPCQLCSLVDARYKATERDGIFGKQFYHNVSFTCLHIYDRKAMNLIRPVKPCVCHICLEELRSVTWQECFKLAEPDNQNLNDPSQKSSKRSNKKNKKKGSLSDGNLEKQNIKIPVSDPAFLNHMHKLFVQKDKVFRKYIAEYSKTINHGVGVSDYHEADMKEFKKSPHHARFIAEAGDLFSSYYSDRITPLSHHLTDTLHLLICCMTACMQLLIVAAQRVEDVIPGLGIHALCHGLRVSGFYLLAKAIESNAMLKLGDKLKTLVSAESGKISETMTFDKATVIEFKKYLFKTSGGAPAERISELFNDMVKKNTSTVAEAKVKISNCNTKALQLGQIKEYLEKLSDENILDLIKSEENQMIDRALFVRRVQKFEVASSSCIDIDITFKDMNFQLPGREARRMLNGGFMNTLQHLNLFAVMATLQNREKMDDHISKIAKLNKKTEQAHMAVKNVIKTLSDIKDPDQSFKNDLEDDSVENICSMVTASLEVLQQHDLDISGIEAEILNTSHDMVLLYSGKSGIEKDPVILQCEDIFEKLKAVLDPIVQPSTAPIKEQLLHLKKHDERARELFQTITNSNLNVKFGDHSEYFHNLCSSHHLARECIYTLENWGIHLADLNCETNEHLNKVLKGLLVHLQGFAHLKLGQYTCDGERDDSILNHLGFVIHEHLVKFYHNFDTLLPRKKPTHCGICDGINHNAAGCPKTCVYCGKGYFRGHRARECEAIFSAAHETKEDFIVG